MKRDQHSWRYRILHAPSLRTARRVVVGVIGGTVTLLGLALLVLPGPAFVVLPIGLSILATEFVWAKRWLRKVRGKVREMVVPRSPAILSTRLPSRSMFRELWPKVFQQLGASSIPPIEPLVEAYSDPARAYHNLEHIEACLEGLQQCGELTAVHAAALFYHDCVYDTKRSDNEEKSADFMTHELQAAAVPEPAINTIRRLILATRHREVPKLRDEQLVADVDLSILGAEPADYRRYVDAIRQEYGWVDDASFAAGRGAFLKKLLARDPIFSTEQFRLALEDQAQTNIRSELDQLECQ